MRRQLISEAKLEPLRVLDLFAGEGNIWNELRRTSRDPDAPPPLKIERYTPVDSVNRQPGQIRFKITPRLIASLDEDNGLSRYNVIEVDCYGDPFELWHEILFRIKSPTAVFLTRGRVTYGAGRMPISNYAKKVMGIPSTWNVPGRIELLTYSDRCQLLQPCPTAKIEFGLQMDFPRVSYYGLFVQPQVTA